MQTPAYIRRMRAGWNGTVRMGVWDAMLMTAEFPSPMPPIHHHFQTAESLRRTGASEWMQVVGLIHDLGVVLAYVRGRAADGTTPEDPWGLTGETTVVEPGPAGAGLDASLVSYGHDEYLWQVLRRSPGVRLPATALRVIRYHSLREWHSGGLYRHLENADDRAARPLVQRFAEHDRYDVGWEPVGALHAKRLRDYYVRLVDQFLPPELLW